MSKNYRKAYEMVTRKEEKRREIKNRSTDRKKIVSRSLS